MMEFILKKGSYECREWHHCCNGPTFGSARAEGADKHHRDPRQQHQQRVIIVRVLPMIQEKMSMDDIRSEVLFMLIQLIYTILTVAVSTCVAYGGKQGTWPIEPHIKVFPLELIICRFSALHLFAFCNRIVPLECKRRLHRGLIF